VADISALSNETIWQEVTMTHPVAGAQDLRPYDVEMAFTVFGENPTDSDWITAAWEDEPNSDGEYLAYAEIGPNSPTQLELAAGLYRIWLRITLATETPVIGGDTINVY